MLSDLPPAVIFPGHGLRTVVFYKHDCDSVDLQLTYNDKNRPKANGNSLKSSRIILQNHRWKRKNKIYLVNDGVLLLHHAILLPRITKACQRLSNFYFLRTSGLFCYLSLTCALYVTYALLLNYSLS